VPRIEVVNGVGEVKIAFSAPVVYHKPGRRLKASEIDITESTDCDWITFVQTMVDG